MSIKPITEQQKAVLTAAAGGGVQSRASIYPQPTVQPVDVFGVLHPDTTGVDNVEIIVDYDGMPNNDILRFYWNGDTTIPAVTADTKPKRVSVPAALVIAAAGKTINVIYSVIDDANPDGVPSDAHTQVIEKYTPPVYPAPVITEAQGGVLDVGALTQNANVSVAAWPGIAVGQQIWLSMTSTPPVTLTKWVGFPITSTGAQSTTITLGKLQSINDGSEVILHFEVSFDGGATRVSFPTQSYVIKQAQLAAPTIASVEDSKGVDIPPGSTTVDTRVTLSGKAANNEQVEIFDGITSKGTVPVSIGGDWTFLLTGLTVKAYSMKATGLYGEYPESEERRFTVVSPVPEFVVDTSPMVLNGLAITAPASWQSTNIDSPGNTQERRATGGSPPYTYRSNGPIASVTGNGKVVGHRNGGAVITVSDSINQSVTYPVQVSNVWSIVFNEVPGSAGQAMAWIRSLNGRYVDYPVENSYLDAHYRAPFPLSHSYWLSPTNLGNRYFLWVYNSGFAWANDDYPASGAWCLVPLN